ncbi:MAG: hypothetical protein IIB90_18815 [Gemmatimonadetes bacterium]|nr:hypothetical protein [Gemmatimonadota bacterium]
MTRNVILALIFGCIVFIGAGISKYLDSRTIRDLRDREMALHFTANESDKRQATLMAQLATDSVVRDSLARFNKRLRLDLEHAKTQRVRIVHVRDSIRATIDEDTLSAGLRNRLDLERGVAESFRAELFIERELRKMAEVQVAQLLKRQRALQLLVLDLQAQRDSALSLAGDAIDAAAPSFFRSLFEDLPRKAACAGAGAVVAELNNGQVLVGAVVALGVCLAVGGIF